MSYRMQQQTYSGHLEWKPWLIRGIIAIVIGLIAIIWPKFAISFLVILFGIYLTIDGIATLSYALTERRSLSSWWVPLLEGLVSLVIGLFSIFYPFVSSILWVALVAFWAIVTGVIKIVEALSVRSYLITIWPPLLGGVLTLILGGLLWLFPRAGVIAFSWMIGIYALLIGLFMLGLAYVLNLADKRPVETY